MKARGNFSRPKQQAQPSLSVEQRVRALEERLAKQEEATALNNFHLVTCLAELDRVLTKLTENAK
jgi:uncharacterized coiled-coil protein SlyX